MMQRLLLLSLAVILLYSCKDATAFNQNESKANKTLLFDLETESVIKDWNEWYDVQKLSTESAEIFAYKSIFAKETEIATGYYDKSNDYDSGKIYQKIEYNEDLDEIYLKDAQFKAYKFVNNTQLQPLDKLSFPKVISLKEGWVLNLHAEGKFDKIEIDKTQKQIYLNVNSWGRIEGCSDYLIFLKDEMKLIRNDGALVDFDEELLDNSFSCCRIFAHGRPILNCNSCLECKNSIKTLKWSYANDKLQLFRNVDGYHRWNSDGSIEKLKYDKMLSTNQILSAQHEGFYYLLDDDLLPIESTKHLKRNFYPEVGKLFLQTEAGYNIYDRKTMKAHFDQSFAVAKYRYNHFFFKDTKNQWSVFTSDLNPVIQFQANHLKSTTESHIVYKFNGKDHLIDYQGNLLQTANFIDLVSNSNQLIKMGESVDDSKYYHLGGKQLPALDVIVIKDLGDQVLSMTYRDRDES